MSKKILVVEDEDYLRDIYVEVLTTAGFGVDEAVNGQEGYDKIKKGSYDLILLDIIMPKVDGIQVLKLLKTNPPSNPVGKILMLTNVGNEALISDSITLGASGYLLKANFTPDKVVEEVKKALEK